MEQARKEFRRLLDGATAADLRRPSDETKWTNQQLLFHMLFGYLVVRALLPLTRLFGRLPGGASAAFARLLDRVRWAFRLVNYGEDGILQFQDGTPALTSAQWTELDAALAKAPNPAPATASSPAPSPAPTSTPAEDTPAPATATPAQPSPSPHGCAAGNQAPAAAPPRDWLAAAGRVGLRLRGRACFDSLQSLGAKVSPRSADSTSPTPLAVAARRKPSWR